MITFLSFYEGSFVHVADVKTTGSCHVKSLKTVIGVMKFLIATVTTQYSKSTLKVGFTHKISSLYLCLFLSYFLKVFEVVHCRQTPVVI